MSEAYGATIAKRGLARRLKELRVEAGYTANQVCDRLNWGRGKVGRFEANSWVRPELSDIRDLARIYEGSDLDELEELAARARRRAWWRDYSDVYDNEFPGFEGDASSIRVVMPLVLPGLLQTLPYMQALLSSGTRTPEWRERALRARLRRQQILDRNEHAPELIAVITEASLMYEWGDAGDRRAQLAHLLTMSRRPNVELRLLRLADGLHPGMSTLVNIFRFPGGEPPMVFLENDAAIQEIDTPGDVEAYDAIFDQIRQAALGPADTADHLQKLISTLE
ncbi:helix-turn-helix domain-containing protein [Actinomadura madurae]|uniref:helix-turn-helix domain-containing protein n=1 Tax=Actinomadura madurae TaxID=1993 RepID=UPI0020D22796|nr:helix-turn-helix transcriptional regulator [Actinomadura madurae]MCP9951810.1 helix-turn-helix domain-containing protein [Actinomadura madurae]MCP9968580.1 helix-turn-helix domain-containing protein [Actinomadura madurae]MCP9981053.1 helix-turn-helix domain-containing protein [Actinomadura madurae]MCQ0007449.1 helix-turn-helix domain-containing protein [Actinomadura madurae]MCQ0017248.1 helix-turn-helix domain-containing protein [Actinomadura madurae]